MFTWVCAFNECVFCAALVGFDYVEFGCLIDFGFEFGLLMVLIIPWDVLIDVIDRDDLFD